MTSFFTDFSQLAASTTHAVPPLDRFTLLANSQLAVQVPANAVDAVCVFPREYL